MRRVLHVVGDRPSARHGRGPEVHQVLAGVHRTDPGECLGGAGVDRDDRGVGLVAAEHTEMECARHLHIVGVDGLAGEELGVLLAQQTAAEHAVAPGGRGVVGDGHS